jgi:hypothetical protein
MRIYQLSPNQPPAAPQAHLPMVYVSRSDAWEYHVLDVPADELPAQEALNQLGKEGWELAGVVAVRKRVIYTFKRLAP